MVTVIWAAISALSIILLGLVFRSLSEWTADGNFIGAGRVSIGVFIGALLPTAVVSYIVSLLIAAIFADGTFCPTGTQTCMYIRGEILNFLQWLVFFFIFITLSHGLWKHRSK